MQFLALGLLAITAGFFFNWLTPMITPKLPAQFQQSKLAQPLITGSFILATVLLASFVLGVFRIRAPKV